MERQKSRLNGTITGWEEGGILRNLKVETSGKKRKPGEWEKNSFLGRARVLETQGVGGSELGGKHV